jgi:hypothetical protein
MKGRLIALSAGLVLAYYASAVPVSVTLIGNPDGTFSTAWRDGGKDPSASVLDCDMTEAGLISVQTGTPFSENISTYVTGSAEGTVETYALHTVDGDNAAAEGLTLVGTTLQHTALQTGSGRIEVRITISGDLVNCGVRQWVAVAPPAGDTMDPPPVSGITTVEGPDDGEFTVSFDQVDDPRDDDAIVGSGIASYLVTHAGGTTPITAGVQPGYSPNWLANPVEVVNFSPNPTSSQSGKQLTLTSAGASWTGQNDEFYFLPTAITGGFRLTAKLNSMSGQTNTFPAMGLVVSAANPAAFGADNQARCGTFWQDTGPGFYARFHTQCRLSAGASAANIVGTSEVSTPGGRCVQMARESGSQVVETRYSTDSTCTIWTELADASITLPDQVYVGPVAFAGSTTPITAVFDWVSLQAYERLEETITAVDGTLTVTAIDDEGNDQVSGSVAYTNREPAVTAQKKFRPGHYNLLNLGDTTGSNPVGTVTNRCTATAAESEVEGVMVKIRWNMLETGATLGSATYTWDVLDQIVENCGNLGESVWLLILDRTFSNPSNQAACPVPAYLISECVANQHGVLLAYWRASVMDRVIALYTAMCERYDDEWYFHGFATEESATSNPVSGSGYTAAALVTQLSRMYNEASRACEKTVMLASLNWLTSGTNAQHSQLMAATLPPNAVNLAVTGPDSCASNPLCPTEADAGTVVYGTTTMQDVFLGVLTGGGLPLRDYRGLLGTGFQSQSAGVDQKDWATHWPYMAILDNHWNFWDQNDWCTGTMTNCGRNMRWTDHILPELREGDKAVNTTCPTTWTLACDTTP